MFLIKIDIKPLKRRGGTEPIARTPPENINLKIKKWIYFYLKKNNFNIYPD